VRAPDIVAEPPAPKPKAPQAAKPKPAMPPPQPSKPIEPKQPTDTKPNPAKPNEVSGKLKVPPLDTAAPRLDALAARAQAAEAAGRAREFDAYLAQVRNAIRRNMNYADEGGPNLEVEVEIRLLPDMTVMDARITRTSGTPTFDDAVRRAVKLTGRYPPLPASIEFGVLRHHLLRYRLHE
jgi:colicin import membrane protein